jgi:NTE family protein
MALVPLPDALRDGTGYLREVPAQTTFPLAPWWASICCRPRSSVRMDPAWPAWRLCVLALALCGAACSSVHYTVNAPRQAGAAEAAYSLRELKAADNSDGLLVFLSLSGGGYRAAAMAHAVMDVLQDTRIEWEGRPRSLLQEVDVISAVSGGSLAAAFYATDPAGFVATFRPRVLDFDLQGALLSRVLSPPGLWRQTSRTYGRGDLLQEVLDEHIFHGLRYGALPRQRPLVSINATNMRTGERFEFTQDRFDALCSDLNAFPLARAVAASMAVPLLLSPITLWDHGEHCPVAPGRGPHSRYLHLVDGGLADNTGVHSVMEDVAAKGGLLRAGRVHGLRGVRKRVFIVVNAQVNAGAPEAESPDTPGLLRQIRSVVDVPIDRHSDSSLQLLDEAVRQWREELGTGEPARSADDRHLFTVIEISMARARDPVAGAEVKHIPTGLRISAGQIETIRRFVRRELALNPAWTSLLRELGAP